MKILNQLKSFIKFAFLLTISFKSFSQKDEYNPQFLIPYYEKGLWGYCDTLGNVKIKPNFKGTTTFFYITYKDRFYARSYINDILLIIKQNGKNLLPLDYFCVSDIYKSYRLDDYIVIENVKNSKRNLFSIDLEKSIIIDKHFMTLSIQKRFCYFKNVTDINYSLYDLEKNKIIKSDILKIHNGANQEGQYAELFEMNNGKYGELNQDKIVEISKADFKNRTLVQEIELSEAMTPPTMDDFEDKIGVYKTDVMFDSYDKTKELIISNNFSNMGFKKLFLVEKNKLRGILNEKAEVIIPVDFDEIDFDELTLRAYVYKNGKVGFQFLGTKNPLSPIKYNLIFEQNGLKVSENHTFRIVGVYLNGHYFYVGQNGVEYFKVD